MTDSSRARVVDLGLSALIWTGTLALLFWPLLEGALTGQPRFFDWDVPEQYWPDLVRLCDQLHGGGVSLWNPHDRGGYPQYADPQAAPYLPLNWAICAAAGPSPSLHWATFRVILGFLVTLVGGHLWLRRTDLGRDRDTPPLSHAASALGAAVLATAPFLRHNWELNLTLGVAWLPWILWATDRLLAAPSARTSSALALATGMCAWSGSPPALWLTATFATGYLALRLAPRLASSGDRLGPSAPAWPLRTLAPWLLLTGALAASLIAVVVVPGQALSARSVQADHTFASLTAESLELSQLTALVRPQPGNHLFLGPVVWLATGAALSARRTRDVALACLGVALLAVLLTLGSHGPLAVVFDVVPGFDRFRLPHRYEAWLGPTAALVTALGLDVLAGELTATRPRRLSAVTWSLALVLTAAHLSLVTARLDPERHTRGGEIPCRGADDAIAQRVAGSPDRVFDEFAIGCRSGTRLGHRDLRGYQDPLMLHAYERVLSRLAERPLLLRQFGVRYALTSPHFLHGWDHHYLPAPEVLVSFPGVHTIVHDGSRRVIDLGEPAPRAYVVPASSTITAASREEALDWLSVLAPARVAILESEAAASTGTLTGTLTEAARLARDVHDEPTASVEDPDDDTVIVSLSHAPEGVLVLNDTFDVGWSADIDGQPAEVVRVNALVRGVRIPAEASCVTFRFTPSDARITLVLWALGWLAALSLFLVPTRRHSA